MAAGMDDDVCVWRVEEGEGKREREIQERKGKDRQAGGQADRQRQASDQMRSAGQVGSLHGRPTSYWVVRPAGQQQQDSSGRTGRTGSQLHTGPRPEASFRTGGFAQATTTGRRQATYMATGIAREGGPMSVINRRIPGRVPSLTSTEGPQDATARYAPHGSCPLSTMRPLYLAGRRRLGGAQGAHNKRRVAYLHTVG